MLGILVFVPRTKGRHWNVSSRRVLGSDLHSKTPSRSCMENPLEAGHGSGLVRAEGGGDKLPAPGRQATGASEILVSLFCSLSLRDDGLKLVLQKDIVRLNTFLAMPFEY